MSAEMIAYPSTVLMCCPTGDGAAAAVLTSGERLKSLPAEVRRRAVYEVTTHLRGEAGARQIDGPRSA